MRRLAAATALGVLANPVAESALRAALEDDVAGVRAAALQALGPIGLNSAAADCAGLLSDREPFVRIAAVRAVGRTASRPGRLLALAAHDDDHVVRLEVARHVGALPEQAASLLFGDRDVRVREAAAQSAGIGQLAALRRLVTEDTSSDVRRSAALTLGRLGGEGHADALVPALEDPDALVRAATLRALTRLLTRAGVVRRLCAELLSDCPARRRVSLYALARLEAVEAAEEVARISDDPDPGVRLALIHAARAAKPRDSDTRARVGPRARRTR